MPRRSERRWRRVMLLMFCGENWLKMIFPRLLPRAEAALVKEVRGHMNDGMRVAVQAGVLVGLPENWRLPPEIDVLGFYITPVLPIILVALLLGLLTVRIGDRFGLSRIVWHPPLFLLALIFIYGFVLAILFLPH
jgi:hypothetical protein